MQAYTELIPSSAISHALALPLLGPREKNLVVVKTSLLQVYRIRHPEPRDGTSIRGSNTERLWLVGEYALAGTVTGLAAVKTLDSKSGGHALLLSFKDAKVSLVEWDPDNQRIRTISIHYYEGDNVVHEPFAPSLSDCESVLTADPDSRCAALKFGARQLAILPFRQAGDDMIVDELEEDVPLFKRTTTTDVVKSDDSHSTPYKASFVLPLTALDPALKHPVHLAFLHEYREPTFGILSAPISTSTSLTASRKDILTYSAFSLDLEQRASTNLVSVPSLPSDLWKVVPLALPVGGALLVGNNEVVHVDQSGKTLAVAVNEFATTASDMSMTDQSALALKLEGCEIVPVDQETGDLLIILRDGRLAVLHFRLQGRNISGIAIESVSSQHGGMVLESAPSAAVSLSKHVAFVGSGEGDSSLISWTKTSIAGVLNRKRSHAQMLDEEADVEDEDIDEDLDDDDLYATAPTAESAKSRASDNATVPGEQLIYTFHVIDRVESLAPVNAMSFGRPPTTLAKGKANAHLQMVAGTGRGRASRLALLTRDIVPRVKSSRTQDFAGARDIWSVAARPGPNDDASATEHHNLMFSYDGQQTRVYDVKSGEDVEDVKYEERTGSEFEHDGETLLVESIAEGNRILHCRRNEIRSYDAADLALSQIIPMLDDETDAELTISHVTITDPWTLVLRDDGSLLVLQADHAGDVEPVNLPEHLSTKDRRWKSGCVYTGTLIPGLVGSILVLLDERGELDIFSLPTLDRVFHAPALSFLPAVISAFEQERRRGGQRDLVSEVLVTDLGEADLSAPYLVVRCGEDGRDVVVYEPFAGPANSSSDNGVVDAWKTLKFRKICSELERTDTVGAMTATDGHHARDHAMRPFRVGKYVSVRLNKAGAVSLLVKERSSLPKVLRIQNGDGSVDSIAPLHRGGSERGFCLLRSKLADSALGPATNGDSHSDGEVSDETLGLFEECDLPKDAHLGSGWFVRRMRLRTDPRETGEESLETAEVRHIAYHEHNGKGYWVVAACALVDFRVEGKDDDEAISLRPQVPQYTIHLLSAATLRPIHSHTLPYLEIVTGVKTMTLEISEQSHELGPRIVVSGGVQRGEDSSARGVLYVFHTLDVVPDPDLPESGVQLSMFSRDETKGIITAIEGFPGGLIGTAQGQKMMVRGLKEDGSCLPVAFLDAQAYTVSLRSLANTGMWLAADAAKGLWFGGFTQEPYRISVLGKSSSRMEVLAAELLPFDGGLYVCVVDGKLDLQVLQYDPENPKSLSGTRLLHKATFHLGQVINGIYALPSTLQRAEGRVEMNGHTNGDESLPSPELFQVLTTSLTGAIGLLTPLSELTYRRLTSLQTHLTNVLEHAAGLNPRAFRFAGDEASGGRGVVDGGLVKRIWELGSARRAEVLARAGADAWTLRGDQEGIGEGGLGYLE